VATFELLVSHRQITVFAAELENPFSEYNDRHVAQGFAWRPHSVSFRTFDDGPLAVTATRRPDDEPSPAPARIIRVPFEVPANGQLKVATRTSAKEIHLPGGHYDLTYELGLEAEGQWCRLLFSACQVSRQAAVLCADAELYAATPLLMKASALVTDD
jgi:Competence protein J (ComJ)